jgi:hypothetical protein
MTITASSNGGHDQVRREAVRGNGARLDVAAAVMSRVAQEIDGLWRDSMSGHDRQVSERLAELSHALHRAARGLEGPEGEIG